MSIIKNMILFLAVIGIFLSSHLSAYAIAPPNKQKEKSQAKQSRDAGELKSQQTKNSTITIIRQGDEGSNDGSGKEGVLIIHD